MCFVSVEMASSFPLDAEDRLFIVSPNNYISTLQETWSAKVLYFLFLSVFLGSRESRLPEHSNKPSHQKTNSLYLRKQRRRSTVQ